MERQTLRLVIRSDGQSGVERAALDAVRCWGLPYGGWCPRGGWAEDYPKPPGLLMDYPLLRETPSAEPAHLYISAFDTLAYPIESAGTELAA